MIPATYLVFDIAEQCIRKPSVDERPLTSSSQTTGSFLQEEDNDHDESNDSLLSFDEQEMIAKGKKRVQKALCAERRAVLKDLLNVKDENSSKLKGGKIRKTMDLQGRIWYVIK